VLLNDYGEIGRRVVNRDHHGKNGYSKIAARRSRSALRELHISGAMRGIFPIKPRRKGGGPAAAANS